MDIYFNYENLVNSHNPLVTLEFQDIKNIMFLNGPIFSSYGFNLNHTCIFNILLNIKVSNFKLVLSLSSSGSCICFLLPPCNILEIEIEKLVILLRQCYVREIALSLYVSFSFTYACKLMPNTQ